MLCGCGGEPWMREMSPPLNRFSLPRSVSSSLSSLSRGASVSFGVRFSLDAPCIFWSVSRGLPRARFRTPREGFVKVWSFASNRRKGHHTGPWNPDTPAALDIRTIFEGIFYHLIMHRRSIRSVLLTNFLTSLDQSLI